MQARRCRVGCTCQPNLSQGSTGGRHHETEWRGLLGGGA